LDTKNDGTPEHPIQLPFVVYSRVVRGFEDDLYLFCESHPEYEHTHYGKTLEDNGIKWDFHSMSNADVSHLDANCIIALLIGAVRADRFCEGALLSFFENGSILRWLERLIELDENAE